MVAKWFEEGKLHLSEELLAMVKASDLKLAEKIASSLKN